MTVYVDRLRKWDDGLWCRMCATSPEELHAMAERIGLHRKWARVSNSGILHYNLHPRKRSLALLNGAVPIRSGEMLRLVKWAQEGQAE